MDDVQYTDEVSSSRLLAEPLRPPSPLCADTPFLSLPLPGCLLWDATSRPPPPQQCPRLESAGGMCVPQTSLKRPPLPGQWP